MRSQRVVEMEQQKMEGTNRGSHDFPRQNHDFPGQNQDFPGQNHNFPRQK